MKWDRKAKYGIVSGEIPLSTTSEILDHRDKSKKPDLPILSPLKRNLLLLIQRSPHEVLPY